MEATELPLACGDHSFPLLEHDKAMQVVAMLGFTGFDLALMGNRSQVRPEHIHGDVPGQAVHLKREIEAKGLRLSDVFVIPWTDFETLAPNHPDADERAKARALFADALELAARIEAPGMTMLPGISWPGQSVQDSMTRAAEELQWRAERAAHLGLRFSVEPHIGSIVSTPEAVSQLLDLAPGLELTLDYTHFVAQGIPEHRVDPLIARARHFQARGARPGRAQCAMKDSTISYERIVDQMIASGYDGYIAIEYVWIEWEGMNECDNLSETVLLREKLLTHFAARALRPGSRGPVT
jgi:sugar phosphate isomerase/epimerase